MDITILFKACVKTVRTTNKDLGIKIPKNNSNLLAPKKDVNLIKAREVVKQLSHLKQFLIENKSAYLNITHTLSPNKRAQEVDPKQVDAVAEDIIHKCSSLINDYKYEMKKFKKTKQTEEHYKIIIDSIETYLKGVSKIYTEAKAIRVKRVIDTHHLSKLGPVHRKVETADNSNKNEEKVTKQIIIPSVTSNAPNVEEELSSEEMQMFEKENENLYNHLNSMSEEVKQLETKIVHIAELQDMFTEKVLQQETDIDRISNVVAGSTEHIKDANDQIRQAIQRNAGLRVWVLFFLLVMSFSLLFLDWYNE